MVGMCVRCIDIFAIETRKIQITHLTAFESRDSISIAGETIRSANFRSFFPIFSQHFSRIRFEQPMRADDILKFVVHRSKNHVARCQCTCNLFQFGRRWRIHCRNMQIIHVCLLLFYIWLAYGNVIRKWASWRRIDLLVCIVRPFTCTAVHLSIWRKFSQQK